MGSTGRLISTDVEAEMVDAARRRAAELAVTNAEFAVADAQALELPDDSVDGVLCRWGYMLMPDPADALTETRRVLRRGGRVALAVWAESTRNPWGTAAGRALVSLGFMDKPDPLAPGPFALGDHDRLHALVRRAGLELAASEEIEIVWRVASFAEWWDVQTDLSRMLSSALAELPPNDVDLVREGTRANLSEFTHSGGQLEIPGTCRVVLARREAAR